MNSEWTVEKGCTAVRRSMSMRTSGCSTCSSAQMGTGQGITGTHILEAALASMGVYDTGCSACSMQGGETRCAVQPTAWRVC